MKTQTTFNWQIGSLIKFKKYGITPFLDIPVYNIIIDIPFISISISFDVNPFKLFYEWLQELGKNCPKETKW